MIHDMRDAQSKCPGNESRIVMYLFGQGLRGRESKFPKESVFER